MESNVSYHVKTELHVEKRVLEGENRVADSEKYVPHKSNMSLIWYILVYATHYSPSAT